jgi:hypothetical protein
MAVFDKRNTALVKSYEKNMVDAYVKALKDINLQLKDIYAKIGNRLNNDVTNNVNLLSQYGRLDKLKAIIEDKFKELNPQLYNEVKNSITSTFQQGYYTTNYINESLTQLNFSLPLLNADQIKAVVLNPMDAIKWNDRLTANLTDTMRRTQSTITQGVLQGKGYQETARNLKKQLDISYNKSIRIVRTESHRSQIDGRNQSIESILPKAKRLGLKPVKVLKAVRDNRTRPQSAMMDGQRANEDGLFEYPNGVKGLPGQTGVAEYDINDRETIITQYDGWSEEVAKKRRGKGLDSSMSFMDWAKKQGLSKNKYGQFYENN